MEGLNKYYGTNIVISEFTYALIQDQGLTVQELDTVRVKGKNTPVKIYELLGYGTLYEQKKHAHSALIKSSLGVSKLVFDTATESRDCFTTKGLISDSGLLKTSFSTLT